MFKRTFTQLNHVLANAKHNYNPRPMDWRMYDRAKQEAAASEITPQVGAVLYNSRTADIISRGRNKQGEHYLIKRYNRLTTHIHAEMNVLLRGLSCVGNFDSIAVARRNKPGRLWRTSYPCNACFAALTEYGVRRFVCCDADDDLCVVAL